MDFLNLDNIMFYNFTSIDIDIIDKLQTNYLIKKL